MGHKQLVASIRLIRHYHLAKPQGGQPGVDRQKLSEHVRANHPSTSELRSQVQTALTREASCAPSDALRKLNSILLDATAAIYPPKTQARVVHRPDFEPLWKLRDALRRHWRRDLQGLFKAWYLSHRHARLARDARRRQVELRRERVSNILQSTQAAADEHMPRKVYQLVSQLKPWCPRPRPRLKSKQGELLTANGEHDRLVSYCRDTFAPALPVPATGSPCLHMSSADWTKYLGQTRVGKAVPKGCAPAAAWKACSDILGPYLERVSQAVEAAGELPSEWCSPELIWLTKPNKAPDVPEHLRPIGLLSPTAKAAAASVRDLLMPGIQRLLHSIPQFAYLANRDIYDALARVNGQIAEIKHSLAQSVANRFVQRQRRESTRHQGRWIQPIGGGAVLSVDLHKAFDMLTREQLLRTLSKLDADEGVKNAAMLLHTRCQYLLVKDGLTTAVDTARGVRQGCRLAPALWSAVSGDILSQIVQDAFAGPITVFADDHLGAWTFHTMEDIVAMEQQVILLFKVLSEAGLSVSPSKSKLVVQVKGAAAEAYLAKRTIHLQGKPHWCFGEGDAMVAVPIVQDFIYLGTVVTLGRPSDRTVTHRLAEARRREGQLRKCIRSRSVLRSGTRIAIWRACVVASALYGLLAQELTAANVTSLRQWYHRSLRAVTGMPAHLTEPLAALLQLTRNKLRRLAALPVGHAATLPATLDHWRKCERNLAILTHTDNLAITPLQDEVIGVPCPYCGVYFQHTKAMRQHTARRHGINWKEPLQITYDPSLHSTGGMPECRHCGKRCGSHQGLKHHIMRNTCGWFQTPYAEGSVAPTRPAGGQRDSAPGSPSALPSQAEWPAAANRSGTSLLSCKVDDRDQGPGLSPQPEADQHDPPPTLQSDMPSHGGAQGCRSLRHSNMDTSHCYHGSGRAGF